MPGPQGTVWYSFVVDSSLRQSHYRHLYNFCMANFDQIAPAPRSSSSFFAFLHPPSTCHTDTSTSLRQIINTCQLKAVCA